MKIFKAIKNELVSWYTLDWLIVVSVILCISLYFNFKSYFKEPEIVEPDNAMIDHYRSVIRMQEAHINYLGAKLNEVPKSITKIKIKHEKSIDTVWLYPNNILDSVFKSEFKRYDSIRETFSVTRFENTIR